jgi:hypothetical protein
MNVTMFAQLAMAVLMRVLMRMSMFRPIGMSVFVMLMASLAMLMQMHIKLETLNL